MLCTMYHICYVSSSIIAVFPCEPFHLLLIFYELGFFGCCFWLVLFLFLFWFGFFVCFKEIVVSTVPYFSVTTYPEI